MRIATIIYEQCLISSGVSRRLWSFARKTLIKLFGDPICSMLIHGKRIKLPLSHALPYHLKDFPFYDRLPQRISEYIHQKQGFLCCIDVGANVGDTIASFYKSDADTFLAIEPNPAFIELLSANWGWNQNVTVVSEVCSSESGEASFVI